MAITFGQHEPDQEWGVIAVYTKNQVPTNMKELQTANENGSLRGDHRCRFVKLKR